MLKKLNKKAIENLNKIIIALSIFIVLIALATEMVKFATRQGDQDICLISVIAADKSGKILGIDCSMHQAGKLKLQGTTEDARKKDAMKQIAELLHDCWYEFGEGKYDPFKSAWVEYKAVCFICSKFSFEAETNIPEEDFIDFLKNTKTSNEVTYYDYLTGWISDEKHKNEFIIDSLKMGLLSRVGLYTYEISREKAFLEPEKDYAVALHSLDVSKLDEIFSHIRNKYSFFIVPYENIEKLSCDRLQG